MLHNPTPARNCHAVFPEPPVRGRAGVCRRRRLRTGSPPPSASTISTAATRCTTSTRSNGCVIEPLPWPGDLRAGPRQHQPRPEPGRSGRRQDRRPAVLARLLHHLRRMAHHRGSEQDEPRLPGIGALPEAGQAGAGAHPQARRAQRVLGGVERRRRHRRAGRRRKQQAARRPSRSRSASAARRRKRSTCWSWATATPRAT